MYNIHICIILRYSIINDLVSTKELNESFLSFEKACISIKSDAQISSIPFMLTILLSNFLLTGL